MRAEFWQWLGASFVFEAVPFSLKGLILWVYEEPTGFFRVLGNGDLALAASILSSSALLDLYMISRRSQVEKVAVFLLAAVTSLIAIGFYGAVSKVVPGASSAGNIEVTVVSFIVYLLATISSWFTLRLAEEDKEHERY